MPRVAFCLLLAGTAPAFAQGQDAPARAFAQARFDEARAGFEAVTARSDVSVEELALAHRYLASLALLFEDDRAAAEHAEAALALSASQEVPEGSPDGTRALLARAATGRGDRRLELALTLPERIAAGAPLLVRAHLTDGASLLAGEIELRCELPRVSPVETRGGGGSVEIRIDTSAAQGGDHVRCLARARSPGGALLRTTRAQGVVGVPIVDRGHTTASSGGGHAWIWIGAGAAVAVAGVVVGVLAASSARDIVVGSVEVEGF